MSPADADHLLAAYGRTGNPKDLAALFDTTAPELFRVALATAPDAASAEDALQETFLTVMDAAPKFDASRRALPWLVGILKFKVAALRSRRFRSRGDEDTPPPALADAPTDGETAPDELARVRTEIEHLSEPYRSVALLRWRYGLSPAEIAHVRGEPPGTVRSILSRSLERLRRGMRAVPALFFGTRTERGLDGVRAHLLGTATAKPGATSKPGAIAQAATSTAAPAWIAGGAAAGVLLTGAILFANSGGGGGGAPPAGAPAPTTLAADAAEKGNPPGLAPAGRDARGTGAASPTVRLRGRCVDVDRKPLAGVRLAVREEFPKGEGAVELSSLPTIGVSAADGSFDVLSPHVVARLVAFSDDGRIGFAPEARAGAEVEVVLRPPRSVRGRTVDEAGKALPGVRVVASTFVGRHLLTYEASSDAQGTFALALPSPSLSRSEPLDGHAYLFAMAIGRGASARSVDLRRPADDVVLELGPVDSWHVTVTAEATGAPVAGAEVTVYGDLGVPRVLFRSTNSVLHPLPPRQLGQSTTGPDGTARVEGLPRLAVHAAMGSGFTESALTVGVRASGYPPRMVPVPNPAQQPIRLQIALSPPDSGESAPDAAASPQAARPPPTLYPVHVIDGAGVGIAEAQLYVDQWGDSRTDASGAATLPLYLPPPSSTPPALVLTVSAAGYVRETLPLPPSPPPSPIRIVLHRGGVIRGRVVEADGTPARGCDVSAYVGSEEAENHRVPSQTDEAGWFRLEGIGERPVVVVAQRASRRPAATAKDRVRVETSDVRAGPGVLELRLPGEALPTSARVVVTVVDEETGEPVAAQYVRFRRGEQAIMVLAESPGRMRETQVPVGTWRLRALADGYPMHVVPFVVREGDTEIPLVVRIGRGLARGGEMRTPDGAAWGDRKLWFSAIDATPKVGSVETVLDGGAWKGTTFRPGRYRAIALGSGDRWIGREPIVVEPGAEQAAFAVDLVAAGSLRVVAPRAATAAEAEYGVSVTTPSGVLVAERTGLALARGVPLLVDEPLPPGAYAVRVTGPDGTSHEQNVTIRAQEVTELELP